MSEIEQLQAWMREQGYTISDLAHEVGMSYIGLYMTTVKRKRLSPGFKLRFIQRFGQATAEKIFDNELVSE